MYLDRYRLATNATTFPNTEDETEVAVTSTLIGSSAEGLTKLEVSSTRATVPQWVKHHLVRSILDLSIIVPVGLPISVWGLVPSKLVDPVGACGSVTVDYDTFIEQPNRCQATVGTCVGPGIDTVLVDRAAAVSLATAGAAWLGLDPFLPNSITVASAVEVQVQIRASQQDATSGSHRLFAEPMLVPAVELSSAPLVPQTTPPRTAAGEWCIGTVDIVESDPAAAYLSAGLMTRKLIITITVFNFGDATADLTVNMNPCVGATVTSDNILRRAIAPSSAAEISFEVTVKVQQNHKIYDTTQCIVHATTARLPLWSRAGKDLPDCAINLDNWAFIEQGEHYVERTEGTAADGADGVNPRHQATEGAPLDDTGKNAGDVVDGSSNDGHTENDPLPRFRNLINGDMIGVGTSTAVIVVLIFGACFGVCHRRRRLNDRRMAADKAAAAAYGTVLEEQGNVHCLEDDLHVMPSLPQQARRYVHPLQGAPEPAPNDVVPLRGIVSAA